MRYLVTAVLLAVSTAASASPAPLPFEVVNVLANTQQVLVYDRAHNTHVLLAPGSTIDDYRVVEISGVGLTVEKEHEQFKVYPRGVQGLALDLDDRGATNRPPEIFSTTAPTPVPARVAAQRHMAVELASLLVAKL